MWEGTPWGGGVGKAGAAAAGRLSAWLLADHPSAPGVTIYELVEGECQAGSMRRLVPRRTTSKITCPMYAREFMRKYEKVLGVLGPEQ